MDFSRIPKKKKKKASSLCTPHNEPPSTQAGTLIPGILSLQEIPRKRKRKLGIDKNKNQPQPATTNALDVATVVAASPSTAGILALSSCCLGQIFSFLPIVFLSKRHHAVVGVGSVLAARNTCRLFHEAASEFVTLEQCVSFLCRLMRERNVHFVEQPWLRGGDEFGDEDRSKYAPPEVDLQEGVEKLLQKTPNQKQQAEKDSAKGGLNRFEKECSLKGPLDRLILCLRVLRHLPSHSSRPRRPLGRGVALGYSHKYGNCCFVLNKSLKYIPRLEASVSTSTSTRASTSAVASACLASTHSGPTEEETDKLEHQLLHQDDQFNTTARSLNQDQDCDPCLTLQTYPACTRGDTLDQFCLTCLPSSSSSSSSSSLGDYNTCCLPNIPHDLRCPSCLSYNRTLILAGISYQSSSMTLASVNASLTYTPKSVPMEGEEDSDQEENDGILLSEENEELREQDENDAVRATSHDDHHSTLHNQQPTARIYPINHQNTKTTTTTRTTKLPKPPRYHNHDKMDRKQAISLYCTSCQAFALVIPAAPCLRRVTSYGQCMALDSMHMYTPPALVSSLGLVSSQDRVGGSGGGSLFWDEILHTQYCAGCFRGLECDLCYFVERGGKRDDLDQEVGQQQDRENRFLCVECGCLFTKANDEEGEKELERYCVLCMEEQSLWVIRTEVQRKVCADCRGSKDNGDSLKLFSSLDSRCKKSASTSVYATAMVGKKGVAGEDPNQVTKEVRKKTKGAFRGSASSARAPPQVKGSSLYFSDEEEEEDHGSKTIPRQATKERIARHIKNKYVKEEGEDGILPSAEDVDDVLQEDEGEEEEGYDDYEDDTHIGYYD